MNQAATPQIPPEWLEPPSLQAAKAIQNEMAGRVIREDAFGPVQRLGGADISHNPRDPAAPIYAALVTLDPADLGVIDRAGTVQQARLPYVPGYLAFREVPSLVAVVRTLTTVPDLIFVDGHGISHPRGLGIASHLGVVLDRPTIGVAKSILIGRPAGELGPEPGDRVPLEWRGRTVGMVLRTKRRANPLYISTGHRISLESAVDWVLRAGRGYRLPEPTRQAHLAANALRTATPPYSAASA